MPYLFKDSKLDHILYICFAYYHCAWYMVLPKFCLIIEYIELISILLHTNGSSRNAAVEL